MSGHCPKDTERQSRQDKYKRYDIIEEACRRVANAEYRKEGRMHGKIEVRSSEEFLQILFEMIGDGVELCYHIDRRLCHGLVPLGVVACHFNQKQCLRSPAESLPIDEQLEE